MQKWLEDKSEEKSEGGKGLQQTFPSLLRARVNFDGYSKCSF